MKRFFSFLLLGLVLGLDGIVVASESATDSRIESDQLQAAWDGQGGCFRLTAKDGKPFASLFLEELPRQVAAADWEHPRLGRGRVLRAELGENQSVQVILVPGLPFALLQSQMAAKPDGDRIVHHVQPFRLQLELPEEPHALKALGTAGLTAPDAHPGSYAFLAVASPQTRAGIVSGWISHDRGCGVVFSKIENGAVELRPQTDYGRLRIAAGTREPGELFALGPFEDARLGLEAYADTIVRLYQIQLRPLPTGYCTWYSNPHGSASDETHLAQLAEVAAEKLKPFGFDFVQIDDMWQDGQRRNGPAKVFSTHMPAGPYPGGMKAAADKIAALGLTPGIWFMPFAGDHEDPFFADHLDWFVKRSDGTPYWARWGGTSLDMTNPAAQAYVRSVVSRLAHDWGYRYFKMDGLWVGSATALTYVNNGYVEDDLGEAVFHDPAKTNIQAYRQGLKLVREAAGNEIFFLGCCIPQNMRSFGAAFGLVDAMRIGPDNGTSWEGLCQGPWHGSNRYFLHGRVWYNDPDPVYVRPDVAIEHARLICSWVALSGQLNVFSEWLPELPEDRVNLLRRTMPNHGLRPRPVDLFSSELARVWLLSDTRGSVRRDVVGLFNWEQHKPQTIDVTPACAGLPEARRYVGYDYWADRFLPPSSGPLQCTLPPGTCRVLSLRPEAEHPILVSTSRHITQGVVDVLEERWDADELLLTGESRVVANDPYELRIVVPAAENSYLASGVEVDTPDARTRFDQAGPTLRVRIDPAECRTVAWRVRFRRGAVEISEPAAVTELSADISYSGVILRWQAPDASRFRIERSDGRAFEVSDREYRDPEISPATDYVYQVRSIGWDGRPSDPASLKVTTLDELKLPPVPPQPDVSIADLAPTSASTGWGTIGASRTCQGEPLRLLGTVYPSGVGVHAPSTLVYAVPKDARRFVATGGLDDEKRDDPRQSVVLRILGDAGEMGTPPVLLAESPLLSDETLRIWHFEVELSTRFRAVHLVVTDGGDGIACDHVDWVNAGFGTGE